MLGVTSRTWNCNLNSANAIQFVINNIIYRERISQWDIQFVFVYNLLNVKGEIDFSFPNDSSISYW